MLFKIPFVYAFVSLVCVNSESLTERVSPAISKALSKQSSKHAKHSSTKQIHLISDDDSSTSADTSTTAVVETTSTTTVEASTTVSVDQAIVYTGTWTTGDFGLCRANCGAGYQYRDIHCVDPSLVTLDFSACDPSLRPSSRSACTGDCLSCEVNSLFLKGMGVSGAPKTPLPVPIAGYVEEVMCQVNATSAVRCCSSETEATIQVVYSQLTRGLKAQTQHRDVTIDRVGAVYTNVTNVLNARIAATSDAADSINAALDGDQSALASPEQALALTNLRQGLLAAFDMRTSALEVAISDIATAQDELISQLEAMNSVDADTADNGDTSNSTDSLANLLESYASGIFSAESEAIVESNFSDEDVGDDSAAASMFMQQTHISSPHKQGSKESELLEIHFDTESEKPVPPSSFLQTANFSDPNLRIASGSCVESLQSFFVGLSCSACNPLFPILAPEAPEMPNIRVPASQCTNIFTACSDTLVTAHQHMVNGLQALLNTHGNLIAVVAQVQPILSAVWAELRFDWLPGFGASQVAIPDLTKMQCVNELKVFQPFPVNNSTDFCNAYLSFASPRAFVKRIGVQIDRGVYAMAKFTSCDRCLHDTIMFLADVLGTSSHGSLRITLPTRTRAMINSCGAATAAPVVKKSAQRNAAKMTVEERVSSRIFYAQPADSLKAVGYYASVNPQILAALASGNPPHEWMPRQLVDSQNVTRTIPVSDNSLLPVGPDAEVQIHVMNLPCTTHAQCYSQDAPSGTRPWWFCAHPNVCTEQPGACSSEGLELLGTGPKCARGPCMNDQSAIDKTCPDNAVCPSSGGSTLNAAPTPHFGEEYFAKFDLKIRQDDPLMQVATAGVCDCAFNGDAVIDECEYARCLAYASLVESKLTCNAELINQCTTIKNSNPTCTKDDTLDCNNVNTILTYPPTMPNECPVNDFALSSDTADTQHVKSVSLVLALVIAILM